MKIILAGEDSILIYFGNKIDPSLPNIIANFANQLQNQLPEYILNLTPAYTSLLVNYNLNLINYGQFCEKVQHCFDTLVNNHIDNNDSTIIEIPVYYDFEVGFDLKKLLSEKNLNLATFVSIHSATQYLIYAIGFSPVFAFLGTVDKRIQMPRLPTPRIKIPAGSVGIADSQTAIYPTDSSGGWNIVGRTPIDLSLNNLDNINKFKTGDWVKFYAITRNEFIDKGGTI